MRDPNLLTRSLMTLRDVNPLWALSLSVVLLALAAGGLVQRHLHDSARLEDRLSGGALVDALRLYAEAAEPGQPVRPTSLAELVDDQRSGQHRAWLDTATAGALGDAGRWVSLRDANGRLTGVQQSSGAAAGGLWSWLAGVADEPPVPYLLEQVPAVAEAAAAEPPPGISLPQPVMPIGGLPEPKLAATSPGSEVGLPTQQRALAGRSPAGNGALPDGAKPDSANRTARLQPGRIIAGLEARQVLRLSGGADEPPLVIPRRAAVVPPRRPAAAGPDPVGAGAGAGVGASVTASRRVTPPAVPVPPMSPVSPVSHPAAAAQADAPAHPRLRGAAASPAAPAKGDPFAPGLPVPLLPGVPMNVPVSPPAANGARVDTVIFEPVPAPVAEPAPAAETALPGNCRALAGDSAECDALDENNGALYQRCYQSVSDRINACLAGEPIPPLILR